MPVSTPDWLARHGGELHAATDGRAYAVYLDHQPHYALISSPAHGKFACLVKQTNNGHRFDSGTTCTSLEDAIRTGLEDLRNALGW